MLEVDYKTWYVRWFFFNCKVLDNFSPRQWKDSRYETYNDNKTTNLCDFFKIIFFGSLATLANILVASFFLFSIIIYPIISFSFVSVSVTLLAFLAIFALVIGMIILVYYLTVVLPKKAKEKIEKRLLSSEKTNPSGFVLFLNFLQGKMKNFCPTIKFKKDV